jgi:hypothetical protein
MAALSNDKSATNRVSRAFTRSSSQKMCLVNLQPARDLAPRGAGLLRYPKCLADGTNSLTLAQQTSVSPNLLMICSVPKICF